MAYKEREFICKVCGNKFNSRRPNPATCGKSCKMKLMGKTLKIERKTIGICEWCNKKFEYIPDKRRLIHRFDTQECRHAYRGQYVKTHGNSEEAKKKISESLSGKSLIDRGFSKEAIESSIDALKVAGKKWNESIKGKTYEEIHGEEKAKEIKQKFSKDRVGENNSFYGHHHTIETKEKIVKNRTGKFYVFASGTFNDIRWQGSYELQLLIHCYDNNIVIKRFNKEPIEYVYQNKIRHYFPDFIILENKEEIIVECKGRVDEKNSLKIKSGIEKYKNKFKLYKKTDFPLSHKNINKWYKQMQQKYSDLLVIKHNPHEVNKNVNKG